MIDLPLKSSHEVSEAHTTQAGLSLYSWVPSCLYEMHLYLMFGLGEMATTQENYFVLSAETILLGEGEFDLVYYWEFTTVCMCFFSCL